MSEILNTFGVDLPDRALQKSRADREMLDEALDPQDFLAVTGALMDLL